MSGSNDGSLAKNLIKTLGLSHQSGRKSPGGGASVSSTDCRRRAAMGDDIPEVSHFTSSSASSS